MVKQVKPWTSVSGFRDRWSYIELAWCEDSDGGYDSFEYKLVQRVNELLVSFDDPVLR